MAEVLQPFEVTNGDTSSVAKNVGKELDALLQKDLLGFESCWTIGSLNDQASLELVGIVNVDGLLKSGWDEEIAE